MVTCAMCHNEQGAPDACDFCHARAAGDPSTRPTS